MEIKFETATVMDAEALVAVQNKAFYADYVRYGICPGYGRTVESMRDSILKNDTYKIIKSGEIVGKVSAKKLGVGDYFLGCLCVIPEYQNRGIGKQALRFIEKQFPDARRWSLKTPGDQMRNLHFYQSCGYSIEGWMMDGSVEVVIFSKLYKRS